MNKSIFVRLAGWLLMVGAIAFLPGAIGMLFWESQTIDWNTPPMQLAAFAVFWAPVLLAVGMLGLRARYGIGGGFLLFGAVVGGVLTLVGTFGQMFAPVYSVSESYYGVWFGGTYILFFCLCLFGVNALVEKPLPRWNVLPLVSGLWFTILPLLFGIGSVSVEAFLIIAIAGFVVMAVAQIMLGYILQADASQETATT